jgi:hypothetical protein
MFDKNYVDSVKKIETYFLKILGGWKNDKWDIDNKYSYITYKVY